MQPLLVSSLLFAKMGGYPWQDAQQWLEAAVRPALHEWTQSHKRELGHHGLREMGELNESLRVIKYELQERRGGADGEWFADLDATLETKSGARLSLSVSAELLGDTDESMMVAGARVQLLWGERLLVEFVGRTNMAVGEGPRGKSAWIEVGDCGGNALDDSGASALSSGGEGGVKESGKPLSERGASGLSEGRVLTDSAALVEACAALTPWIDSLPDFVECVCGIAVMPEGDVARAFRTITIEEVVEEQCWLEEEGGESGDESGGEQGGHADQKSRPNAGGATRVGSFGMTGMTLTCDAKDGSKHQPASGPSPANSSNAPNSANGSNENGSDGVRGGRRKDGKKQRRSG